MNMTEQLSKRYHPSYISFVLCSKFFLFLLLFFFFLSTRPPFDMDLSSVDYRAHQVFPPTRAKQCFRMSVARLPKAIRQPKQRKHKRFCIKQSGDQTEKARKDSAYSEPDQEKYKQPIRLI